MNTNFNSTIDKIRYYLKRFFGKRIVKTGVAVSLSLWISQLLSLRMHSMVALAVITTMRSSIFESWYDSVNRMYSTFIGIILGSLFQYLGLTGYVAICFGIIIIINITNYFKWNDATNLALMVFVIVIIYVPDFPVGHPEYMDYITYSLHRAQDTFIGLGIGFAVNYLIFPPKKEEIFIHIYANAKNELDQILYDYLQGKDTDLSKLMNHIEIMAKELPYTRENIIGKNVDIKTSELAKINATFTSAFGLLSKFVEDKLIPKLSDQNLESISRYFDKDMIPHLDYTTDEYNTAFNYYFKELMDQLFYINDIMEDLDQRVNK